jgi:hypothetical protein
MRFDKAVYRLRRSRVGRTAEAAIGRHLPALHALARRRWRRRAMVTNAFGVSANGRPRACLSYVPWAFLGPQDDRSLNHSNQWECVEIGRILDDLGYIVDVVDCLTGDFEPKVQYDLFIEAGYNLDHLLPTLPRSCVRVAYATGRHWLAQNTAELNRLEDLRGRRGVVLLPRRAARPTQTAESADAVLALGNEVVLESYNHLRCPTYSIPLSFPGHLVNDAARDMEAARSTFLWLGSGGMVHKGLDLVLELFAARPDLVLHVVGPVVAEPDFAVAYEHELFHSPNIHVHGFLDLAGSEFRRIARQCVGLVYPSCSETTSGAVLAAMANGIVPIVSRETAADVEPAGVVLRETNLATLGAAVQLVSSMSESELLTRSASACEIVRIRHSRGAYSAAVRRALQEIVTRGAPDSRVGYDPQASDDR